MGQGLRNTRPSSFASSRLRAKQPGNAFTLTVANHCVVAIGEVDLRRSTRDWRLERPLKNLCLRERKTEP